MANLSKSKALQSASLMAAMLIPTGFFLLTLRAPLPTEAFNWLLPLRLPHFLAGLVIYACCFRLSGKAGWLVGSSLTAVFFALLLSRNWTLGISNANIIGGFIPYKDGFYYYNSAEAMLSGQLIPENGLQGAFRPLFPGLLAVLLFATNHNLMWATAIVTLFTALTCFLAAWAIRDHLGASPASVLMVLMLAFIAPMVGFNLTELPGLAYACLAFVLLATGGAGKNPVDMLLGALALILANSIRAGAFFILPLLALWAGIRLNEGQGISVKKTALFLAVIAGGITAANFLYPRLVTAPGALTNGSFAWMLYGQAVGGAGWQYHYQALGTSDPHMVLQAAIRKILSYPQGFAIGALKAYRDLFSNSRAGIFDLFDWHSRAVETLFWLACLGQTLAGLFSAAREPKKPFNLLMLVTSLGILLSIPFLPPIDGGKRFYAGAVPFIYGLIPLGLVFIKDWAQTGQKEAASRPIMDTRPVRIAALAMFFINLAAPLVLLAARQPAALAAEPCLPDQVPYSVALHDGAVVDILPDNHATCGRAPRLCLTQFDRFGLEKGVDDFFRELLDLAQASEDGLRLAAVHDRVTQEYYFFALPVELIALPERGGVLSGCAQPIRTQFQNIRLAQSARLIEIH